MRFGGLLLLAVLAAAAAAQAAGSSTGTVSGRVLYDDGTDAAFARVVFLPGGWNTTASSSGAFVIDLPPGEYTLRASGGGAVSESNVTVRAGVATVAIARLDRGGGAPPGSTLFPVLFLVASMVGVTIGGFYVNRRMAESGLDINKSVMGGAAPRKPFRRRTKKRRPPSP